MDTCTSRLVRVQQEYTAPKTHLAGDSNHRMPQSTIIWHIECYQMKKWGRHAVTHELDQPTADMAMLHHTATSANSSIPHTSDLYPPSRHTIPYYQLYEATKRHERCTSNQKRTPSMGRVQFEWTCARDESSWTKELVRMLPVDHFHTIYIVF
jgi:hypothetical protein